jgi:hypothetical protein
MHDLQRSPAQHPHTPHLPNPSRRKYCWSSGNGQPIKLGRIAWLKPKTIPAATSWGLVSEVKPAFSGAMALIALQQQG